MNLKLDETTTNVSSFYTITPLVGVRKPNQKSKRSVVFKVIGGGVYFPCGIHVVLSNVKMTRDNLLGGIESQGP